MACPATRPHSHRGRHDPQNRPPAQRPTSRTAVPVNRVMHPLPPPIQGIRCSTTSPATSATVRASLRARPNRYLRAAAGRTARHCMTTPTAISTRTAGGNSSDSPSSDDSHTALPSLSPVWRQRPRRRETNYGLGDRQSQLIDAMTSPPGAQGGWRTPPAAGLRPRPGTARRSGGSGGRRRPPHDAPKAAVRRSPPRPETCGGTAITDATKPSRNGRGQRLASQTQAKGGESVSAGPVRNDWPRG